MDASLNHFVAAHYSSRHMNWLHGFWGVGATTGPLIMGLALASTGGWALGVRSIGLMQLVLAVVLFATLALWAKEHSKPPAGKTPMAKRLSNRFARWRYGWHPPCFCSMWQPRWAPDCGQPVFW